MPAFSVLRCRSPALCLLAHDDVHCRKVVGVRPVPLALRPRVGGAPLEPSQSESQHDQACDYPEAVRCKCLRVVNGMKMAFWIVGVPPYVSHRPERTLLYQLVEEYEPAFEAHLAAQGTCLPGYVEQEFEDYLKCGPLEHGFIPGILPFTPSGPACGCSNTFPTYLSAGALRQLPCRAPGSFQLQEARLLLRAFRPPPFGPACACSKSLQATWSGSTSTNR